MDDASYLNDGYDSVRDRKSFFHASPHRFQAGDMLSRNRRQDATSPALPGSST